MTGTSTSGGQEARREVVRWDGSMAEPALLLGEPTVHHEHRPGQESMKKTGIESMVSWFGERQDTAERACCVANLWEHVMGVDMVMNISNLFVDWKVHVVIVKDSLPPQPSLIIAPAIPLHSPAVSDLSS